MISREEWLRLLVLRIEKEILNEHNYSLPEYWSVGVGFPSVPKAIGQAWDKEACSDKKTHHIFISPILGDTNPENIVNLMQVLLHEVIHITVGIDQKHGGDFKKLAREIGLEGRLTATYVSPDNPLYNKLENIYYSVSNEVGHGYPHEVIIPLFKPKKEREKQIKLVSKSNPEYIVKSKQSMIENYGYPKDPWGEEMEYLVEN